ncbi:hypothetical protein QTP88_012318 [Uroleucon formosanum]
MLSQMLCNIPQIRLKSRKPPWITAQYLILTNFNSITEWRTAWNNLTLQNADLVVNSIQPLEGFKLPRQEWTIQHIVSDCPKRKFEGKMSDFFRLTSEALDRTATLDIRL